MSQPVTMSGNSITEKHPGYYVLKITDDDLKTGHIELAESALRTFLAEKTVRDRNRALILDMEGVNDLDSSGVGFLLATHKKLSLKNDEMVISNCRPAVQKIIEVLHLDIRPFHGNYYPNHGPGQVIADLTSKVPSLAI